MEGTKCIACGERVCAVADLSMVRPLVVDVPDTADIGTVSPPVGNVPDTVDISVESPPVVDIPEAADIGVGSPPAVLKSVSPVAGTCSLSSTSELSSLVVG